MKKTLMMLSFIIMVSTTILITIALNTTESFDIRKVAQDITGAAATDARDDETRIELVSSYDSDTERTQAMTEVISEHNEIGSIDKSIITEKGLIIFSSLAFLLGMLGTIFYVISKKKAY